MKHIYILNGHPAEKSLSRLFAETYAKAAKLAGHEVRMTHLHDLSFDSDYGFGGYSYSKPLEPELEAVLANIEWSDHLVLTAPMWWGGLPAKLKGLIDRIFLPGKTFDTKITKYGMPTPMLTGRTARIILTSDTPGWFLRLIYKNAIVHQIRRQILGFVGIKPTRVTHFAGASHPAAGKVAQWARKVETLGGIAA